MRRHAVLALFVCFFVGATSGCRLDEAQAVGDKGDRKDVGVAIRQDGLAEAQADLEKRIDSAPALVMEKSGLAGVMGGAHVQVISTDPQEVLLPIPQLADSQVPLCYFIRSTPPEAATEFRLGKRDEGNVSVRVRLAGKRRDIKIAWSSIVLLAPIMIGCPYGQEIEMLTQGVTLFGEAMFWTEAKPLAEFASSDEINRLAAEAWNRYLDTGTLTEGQRKSAGAKTAKELVELLKAK